MKNAHTYALTGPDYVIIIYFSWLNVTKDLYSNRIKKTC